MQEDTKISDLTVAEFRALMQQCFDRDRALESQRELARQQANGLRSPITESQGLAFMQQRLNPASRMGRP